ncbi:hypothetical protein SAMN05216252_1562 [Actinacidiphila glaucinigra]|uniref:Transposase n=2 Tax=Actinacidiphila glaucinigra TaxID=235986 RepID=A0A239NXA9_9ACTN|nr:hypothetical protein SAMN05216252_1562 [Actinacidiphila glaucinigra]
MPAFIETNAEWLTVFHLPTYAPDLSLKLKKIGSRWRALSAGKIAGIVLAVLRVTSGPVIWPAGTRCTAPRCPGGCGKSSGCWLPAPRA